MQEQRQTVRVDAKVDVSLRADPRGPAQKVLSSRALHAQGIQLLLPNRLPLNQRVELEIYLPAQAGPLKAVGEVSWVEHIGDVYEGYYQVGIRFLELADSARQVIEELIRAELAKLKPLPSEG